MKQLRTTILAVAALLAVAEAGAWNAAGHRAVGTLADSLIAGTPAAVEVRRILGSNLRTAAVWADCAKGVNTTDFLYEARGVFPECAVYENPASERQMEDFVRRNHANCVSPHNGDSCHKQYHYADIAIQRNEYRAGYVGASEQDVVAALDAALAVLQDRQPAPPFDIAGKREALRLLAHYVGDIHQPLHVAAVYVDAQGKVVDPDAGSFDPKTGTHGGNDLLVQVGLKTVKLHGDWDSVHAAVPWDQPPAAVLARARAVPLTPGELAQWPTAWATESLLLGAKAYGGVEYGEESAGQHAATLPAGYAARVRTPAQREQVLKAGARLAQLVQALWP
jgi:hypothetical protein